MHFLQGEFHASLEHFREPWRLDAEYQSLEGRVQGGVVPVAVERNVPKRQDHKATKLLLYPLSDLKHRQLLVACTLVAVVQNNDHPLSSLPGPAQR